jgi:hypothetical protein
MSKGPNPGFSISISRQLSAAPGADLAEMKAMVRDQKRLHDKALRMMKGLARGGKVESERVDKPTSWSGGFYAWVSHSFRVPEGDLNTTEDFSKRLERLGFEYDRHRGD